MAYLAFLGTISGMVIMSLNYPFILHTVSYTFSGVILTVMHCKEKAVLKSLKAWEQKG